MQIVLALLRGDHSLSDARFASALGESLRAEGSELTALPEEIFDAMGAHPGSLGAVGAPGHKIFADAALRMGFKQR